MSSHDEILRIALSEFATAGYAGTSLQRVAELAGLSKSSVLYHFASKEALLEAAVGPAIDRMDGIIAGIAAGELTPERRVAFIEGFVDVLLAHRLEVSTFLGQGTSLVDVPVIDRANALVERISAFFCVAAPTAEDQMRFGIAMGGSAYILGSLPGSNRTQTFTDDEIRTALITIMTELLAPVSVRTNTN